MRNYNDYNDDYNYSPNEMTELSINDYRKYMEIMRSNFEDDDAIDKWKRDNLEFMKKLHNR